MKRLTMTDDELSEIPNCNCPVKVVDDRTQYFCESVCDEFQDNCPFMRMAQKLKEYEDLEEQGLLLMLPCPIGAPVYYVQNCLAPNCKECGGFVRVDNCYTEHKSRIFEQKFGYRHLEAFGKRVFLTKEEAEAALEKMKV